jgi:2,4-diaminopentanoate dehydrogenase
MAYRIIQWGAGMNGQALIRAIARHPDLELVGCRVWSESKNGVDAGTLAGIAPLGVLATTDRQALIDLDADVVISCPHIRPDFSDSDRDIVDLLRSGKNVISVSGAYSMPSSLPNGYAKQFEEACRDGGTSFTSAGLNPGFIAERLATTLTGLCADVESLHVEETYLVADDTADIIFDTVGFGKEMGEWSDKSAMSLIFDRLFVQLIHNVAYTLGVELAEVKSSAELVPAHRDIELPAGLIKKGTVAALTMRLEGIPKDPSQIKIFKQARWVVATDIPGIPVKSGWQIRVEGKPNLIAEIRTDPEGDRTYHHETMVGSAIGVIPEVIAAQPGILLPKIYAPFKRRFVAV